MEEFYEIVPRPAEGFSPFDEEDGFLVGCGACSGTCGPFGILLKEVEIAGGSEISGSGADGLGGEVLDFFIVGGGVGN